MSEHYYSKKTAAKSDEKTWSYTLRDRLLTFTTDHAVFSKGEVDFGSRLLIESFTAPPVDGNFLDLGCGYGPIGLSLALEYPDRQVVMVDVNERALNLAEKNAAKNQVTNVEIKESDRLRQLEGRQFAAILTNPPVRAGKKVVHAMFEEAKKALGKSGELWVVIQKKQGAPSAKQKIEELFGNIEVVRKENGYYIFKAQKFD
ncbi:16S rRNA methyltransferase [Halobacillus halophilus]|uniref:16S rRNA methyltransferase n=1 Tax=Halobacillus halophilus (strain ATCC 35676 / DSM 2266 / JCM 20832 / KCTC 3685 / LMG 17431 / NBRC 102448 / NCIMB 2269) TaxID=866895 RepID=I0JH84_HALH3|nr:class I SAM-dependent methyltransferase [Halobacillus halophilus]ASF37725.1 16S rRNA methyltransferase [Halobacillus halophilus]CCG43502.1 putative 16S rRNA methyltransferase [Halobacillus halophilus DSM 2266]